MQTQHALILILILLLSVSVSSAQDTPHSYSCPGAPASRLVNGARGRILPGTPNRLRRETSTESGILADIPAGKTFTILDGPTCAENMAWWQVEYRGQTGWTAEGQGDAYWIEPSLLPDLEPITADNVNRLGPIAMLGVEPINEVAWSPDGNTLLAAGSAGLWRFDLTQPDKPPHLIEGYAGLFRSVAYSPDGKYVVTGNDLGAIRLWDTATWTESGVLQTHGTSVEKVVFSTDGQLLATGSFDGSVQIWDFATRAITHSWKVEHSLNDLAFSPDGATLVIAYWNNVKLYNLKDGTQTELVNAWLPSSIAFNADGSLLAIGNQQMQGGEGSVPLIPVTFYDPKTGKPLYSIDFEPLNSVSTVAFEDADTVIVGSWGTTNRWLLDSILSTTPMSDQAVGDTFMRDSIEYPVFYADQNAPSHDSLSGGRFFRLNATRTQITIVQRGNTIYLVDLKTGAQKTLQLPFFDAAVEGFTQTLAFSPTQPLVAFGSDNDIQLVNIETGIPQSVLTGHELDITALTFSPSGEVLASGSGGFALLQPYGYGEDGSVRIWNLTDKTPKAIFGTYSNPVSRLHFNADGNTLFIAFEQGGWNNEESAYLMWKWAANTFMSLDTRTSYAFFVTFSPVDPIAALVSNTESSHRLDLLDISHNLSAPLMVSTDAFMGEAAFSSDGTLVATGPAIVNVKTGESISLNGGAIKAAFSSDDSLLAYFDTDLVLWDVNSRTERLTIPMNGSPDYPLFFTKDGTLVFADYKLWNVQSGEMTMNMYPLRVYGDLYPAADISSDGKVIAIPEGSGIRLWGVPAT